MIDFPSSPTEGQEFTSPGTIGGTITWIFKSPIWTRKWILDPPIIAAGSVSGGQTQIDIELSPAYDHFELRLTGFNAITPTFFGVRASVNNGGAYANGDGDYMWHRQFTYSGSAATVIKENSTPADYTSSAMMISPIQLATGVTVGAECTIQSVIDIDNARVGLGIPQLQYRITFFYNHATTGFSTGQAMGNGQPAFTGRWTNLRLIAIEATKAQKAFTNGAWSLVGLV
jgi:hypothetical protein